MDRQGWLQLTAVQAGGAICLPVFVIGHALGKSYGMASAAMAIVLGNTLLLALAFVSGVYSAEKRLSTIQCAIACFGDQGKGGFSSAMVLSMIGWFAIQLHLMGECLNQILPSSIGIASPLGMGVVMTALGTRGLRGVEILANLSMPLLIATIVVGLVGADKGEGMALEPKLLTMSGLSLVLACSIGAVVDLPTFFRSAKSRKDAVIAVCVLFVLVIPSVEMVGVILSSSGEQKGFLDVLMGAHASGVWELWVLCFVLIAGWTTNSANLYSAAVSLEPVLQRVEFSKRTLLAGSVGTLLSVFPLLDGLELVLQPIGVVLTSMGAVLIVCFLSENKTTPQQNFASWMIGAGAGMISLAASTVTGIAVLDGFIASLIAMGAFSLKKERWINEKND